MHTASLKTGTPDSPNGIDYELYVTKKVWSKTVGGDDVIADRIFHYHQVRPVVSYLDSVKYESTENNYNEQIILCTLVIVCI